MTPGFPLWVVLAGGAAVAGLGYAAWRYRFSAAAGPGESEDERGRREAASAEMGRVGMAAAFPLVSQGELLGYLLLGEKKSEESYSDEDLLLLRIVANQAALAYQRVRYMEMAVQGARTQMLSAIASGFAHEIKTPLANISLPAEMGLMELREVAQGRRRAEEALPELKRLLKGIMEQAFKASEKIEAIRQFSKPGQAPLEAVDLSQVLRNSLALLDHPIQMAYIQVKNGFPDALPCVLGNPKQLEIVFVNLIKNAVEAMAQSPGLARVLELGGGREGEWITVLVRDTGQGIKYTDFNHLFKAYFTTKGSEGTGMGLFLSQQVIKAHGGSIDVRTEEGQGTEFVVRLPRYAPVQTRVHEAA